MSFSFFSFVRNSIDSYCQAAKQRLRQWTKPDNQALVLNTALDVTRSRSELVIENMLLRQQLIVVLAEYSHPFETTSCKACPRVCASVSIDWVAVVGVQLPANE